MLYEKLDYVLAIAEEQNLTRAAKKLYISQPTLTMYLNRLEENLGVKLFDRKKNQTCSCRRRHSSPEGHIPCRLLCTGHSYAEGAPADTIFF